MSSNYGYGYDQYAAAAYAGYTAAAQYQAMATPATSYYQQPPSTQSSNTQQYGTYSSSNYQSYQPPVTYPPYIPSQPSTSSTVAGNTSTTPTSYSTYSTSYTSSYSTSYSTSAYGGYAQSGSMGKTGSGQSWNSSDSYSQTNQVSYPTPNNYSTYSYPQYGNYGYGTTNSATTTSANITPLQQTVIAKFAHQKMKGGDMKSFLKKKVYESPEKYYCEICKAGCGSAFTYKAHIEGKNHRKRLQQLEKAKLENPEGAEKKAKTPFYCDVCEIGCSSKDAFEAHIKGNRHIKTVNLFRRLGKPVPVMTTSVSKDNGVVQVSGPRITFVGGKKLSSTGLTLNKTGDGVSVYPPGAPQPSVKEDTDSIIVEGTVEDIPPDIEPVGEHLVDVVTNDPRSPNSSYYCTMCACFFNDALAKTMHCKGRRHRLNYKKMYDPKLKVELPKSLQKQIQKKKEKLNQKRDVKPGKKSVATTQLQNLRHREAAAIASMQRGRGYGGDYYNRDYEWMQHRQLQRNPEDDKLLFFKHKELCPEDEELKATLTVVSDVEKALKMVSDDLLVEKCQAIAVEKGESSGDVKKDESHRQVRGIMRIGSLARETLIKGNLRIDLLLMCVDKPTKDLLNVICDCLPSKFASLADADQKYAYHVTSNPRKAGLIVVATIEEYPVTVHVTLTSTMMKTEQTVDDEEREIEHLKGVLDRPCCVAALSALHQTQWFQAQCKGLPCFSLTVRIFTDLVQHNAKWSCLEGWILELLVFKCIITANPDFMYPGDVFRRVIECIASGVFLPGGSGLMDPCSGNDAAESLTPQQRADITFLAQHYLRMIAFNQLHSILGITPPDTYAPYQLKRLPSTSTAVEETEESDSKKPRTD